MEPQLKPQKTNHLSTPSKTHQSTTVSGKPPLQAFSHAYYVRHYFIPSGFSTAQTLPTSGAFTIFSNRFYGVYRPERNHPILFHRFSHRCDPLTTLNHLLRNLPLYSRQIRHFVCRCCIQRFLLLSPRLPLRSSLRWPHHKQRSHPHCSLPQRSMFSHPLLQ